MFIIIISLAFSDISTFFGSNSLSGFFGSSSSSLLSGSFFDVFFSIVRSKSSKASFRPAVLMCANILSFHMVRRSTQKYRRVTDLLDSSHSPGHNFSLRESVSMDETVCVIAGQWICAKDGVWAFKIKKDEKIRSVTMSPDLCFEQLERMVMKAFRVDPSKQSVRLSFWSPEVSNFCTQTRLPPVAVESDSDVVRFARLLSSCSGLNIFATFEDFVEVSGKKVPSPDTMSDEFCIVEEKESDICLSDGTFEDIDVLRFVDKVEAAYAKKAGKRPVDESVNLPFGGIPCPSTLSGQGQSGHPIPTAEQDPDVHFNELVALVDKENIFPGASTNTSPIPTHPTFSLGVEGLDGPTPFGSDSSYPSSEFFFGDENGGVPAPLDENHPLFDDPPPNQGNFNEEDGAESIYVGRVFQSKAHLHRALATSALERLFCYKIQKSDKRRVIAVCVDRQCQWRVYATAHRDSEYFEVRTFNPTHSCDVQSRQRFGEKASSRVLAELLHSKYANGKNGPRACDLPELVRNEFNVTISYMKAWHAKEVALSVARGNEEQSFKLLSSYLQLLKQHNPGTITDLYTVVTRDGVTHFKFLFLSFGPSVSGVPYLRKVVVIDGTQMKGKYKGCLVAASCQDGNMQIFPLAFGVVDSENEKSWIWFLENLSKVVPDSPELVFVSDRCPSIYVALSRVYPQAKHGACIVHLYRNVKSKFKCEGLAVVVSKAARAYTIAEFRHWWTEIENRSPACAQFLTDIGFAHWTLSHFPGNRYNIMTSNIAESLNAAMAKAADYPLVSMLEFIRTMVMRWFSTRREMANRSLNRCTPVIEDILVKHLQQAVHCTVLPASHWIYQVNDSAGQVYTVNLQTKSCTCRVFDVLKLPCSHAIAARRIKNMDIYTLVDSCYYTQFWQALYQPIIMPVPRVDNAISDENMAEENINPPLTRRPPGRPKKVRIPSKGEGYAGGSNKYSRCARCQGIGHNKATCKNPI